MCNNLLKTDILVFLVTFIKLCDPNQLLENLLKVGAGGHFNSKIKKRFIFAK